MQSTLAMASGLSDYLWSIEVLLSFSVPPIERPKRSHLRRNGESDPIDAEAAARAVLAGEI